MRIALAAGLVVAAALMLSPTAHAQTRSALQAQAEAQAQVQAQAQARIRAKGEALALAQMQNQVQVPLPRLPEEKCLRALDGKCVDPMIAEAARLRAIIVPTVRVSFFGTPAGTIGGRYIPFERLFQDDVTVFGLPTSVYSLPCCVSRSK
jgi:hypothetical protein